MTPTRAKRPSFRAPLALLLAALLPALFVLGGCFASRAPVPTPVQRTPEAEGRKARMEREATEAKPAAPEPEAKPAAKAEAAPAPKADPTPAAEPAKPEAAPAPAPAAPKAEAKPVLDAEQRPAKELTLQGQFVQIASFGTEKYAQNAVAWLAANGYAASRVVRVEQAGGVLHRVQAGPFQDPAAARGALDALKAQWPQAFIPAD